MHEIECCKLFETYYSENKTWLSEPRSIGLYFTVNLDRIPEVGQKIMHSDDRCDFTVDEIVHINGGGLCVVNHVECTTINENIVCDEILRLTVLAEFPFSIKYTIQFLICR